MQSQNVKSILVSRTDAIGDVILTLPLVGLLRKQYPKAQILFLGSSYTKDILAACKHVDQFINWSLLAKMDSSAQIAEIKKLNLDVVLHVFPDKSIAQLCAKAGVPIRIGTSSRLFHWFTCNNRPALRRNKSDKHEAELNVELAIKACLLPEKTRVNKEELWNYYGFEIEKYWPKDIDRTLMEGSRNVILHVGSNLSARNWPVEHFLRLAQTLTENGSRVFLTGTQAEGAHFRMKFMALGNSRIIDLTGKMNLKELFGFIASCDLLVACSTGPLHMAAAAGIKAVGIYPPIRPMHAGRWAPIGKDVRVLTQNERLNCQRCTNNANNCLCMREITPNAVYDLI